MIFGAVSAIQKGQAESAQKKAQAQIAESNAVIARRAADDERVKGSQEARQKAIETARLIGMQRAGAAASGVVVDAGSALDLTADSAAFGKLDQLRITNNAERRALGFETKAANFDAEADALEKASGAAQTAGFLNAGTSLLGGFAKAPASGGGAPFSTSGDIFGARAFSGRTGIPLATGAR
jgi:membrane protein involved in colicin uptake